MKIARALIDWKDDNHAHVHDLDTGHEFNITVRPKENAYAPNGSPVKPRLYVNGPLVREEDEHLTYRGAIAETKKAFLPTLEKILNRKVKISFSRTAGCSCGCSPGFIVQDGTVPFNIWMDSK